MFAYCLYAFISMMIFAGIVATWPTDAHCKMWLECRRECKDYSVTLRASLFKQYVSWYELPNIRLYASRRRNWTRIREDQKLLEWPRQQVSYKTNEIDIQRCNCLDSCMLRRPVFATEYC